MILPLLDRSAERIQLSELATLVIREEQPNGLEPLGEPLGDSRAQNIESLASQRRHSHRFGKAIRKPTTAQQIDGVDLVHNELARKLVRADVVQDGLDRADLLVKAVIRSRRVDDVEDEIGDERLFQCRGESLDELRRQPADEPDRVCQEVATAFEVEAASGRVERLEQPVLDGDLCAGERVQQRRLPHIRVSGERNGRRLRSAP